VPWGHPNPRFWLSLLTTVSVSLLAVLIWSKTGGSPDTAPERGWNLVWNDEFTEARCPDPAQWGFEHGFIRNFEAQWYQRRNARCRHGLLEIVARRTQRPNPEYDPASTNWGRQRRSIGYTSASLTSRRTFTYGRFEMRARIDTRSGSWPAFWTLGAALRSDPNAWPRSGEIDVMEYYRGTVQANVCKPRRFRCAWSSAGRSLAELGGRSWTRRFHVWGMDWSSQRIELFLDGRLLNRFPVADAVPSGQANPYVGQPLYLLLTQAIGGTNGGDPTGTRFPVRLTVDWVRAYQRR
jgi:beta-glucanase (GH16 family)